MVKRKQLMDANTHWIENIVETYNLDFRSLQQRLCEIGRGETSRTCQLDVPGGELRDLGMLLRIMLAFDHEAKAFYHHPAYVSMKANSVFVGFAVLHILLS